MTQEQVSLKLLSSKVNLFTHWLNQSGPESDEYELYRDWRAGNSYWWYLKLVYK